MLSSLHKSAKFALLACCMLVFVHGAATSLEFPKLSNLLNLSEKATDEIREEDRVSEVLNQDASYLSLFESIRNPDVCIQDFVKPGEELKYQAKWKGFPAGTIRCSAKRMAKLKNRPVFVFELSLESNDFMSPFYAVKTNINSYVDASNGRSYLIRRRVSEGKRSYHDRLEFKYDYRRDNGIADPISKYSMVGTNGKEVASLPFPIPGNMQDMVSIIYYIRGMELTKVGDSCELLLGGRKKPVITSITVINEEEVTIPNIGKLDCLVLEPVTDGTNISGNFVATRGGEKVWLEKNTRIPVMVSAELPLGAVVATLIQADNSELLTHVKKDEDE